MTAPVIAVAWPRPDYVTALEQAGATVRVLDPGLDDPRATLDACDGLLLTGGVDVDPMEYGERERHPAVELDPERDRYELSLARAALDRDMPVLAICRGAQVLNVAAGGSLVQDIGSGIEGPLTHTIREPRDAHAHDVSVTAGSRLERALGSAVDAAHACRVNSRHHQSVARVGAGLIASATASDGVIEAIEKPDARFCLGVQWHPENFCRTGEFSPLFTAFIESARRR